MAQYINTADGQSSGTTLTTGNSGGSSGDALDQVVKSGSGNAVFSNEQAMHGTQSYKITSGSSSAVYLMYDKTGNMYAACQMMIYATGLPDVNQGVLYLRTVGGGSSVATISITSTGALRLNNAATSLVNMSSSGIISLNTWIRLDLFAYVGTTTSNGRIMGSASTGDSTTTLWSHDTGFAANAGTSAIGNYRFGKLDTVPNMATYYVDDLRVDTTAESLLPPRPIATSAWFTA